MPNIKIMFVAFLSSVSVSLYALKVGDNEAAVLAELGTPLSTVKIAPNVTLLSFERGDVLIKDGKIDRLKIVSKEAFEKIKIEAKKKEDAEKARLDAVQALENAAQKDKLEQLAAQKAKDDLEASQIAACLKQGDYSKLVWVPIDPNVESWHFKSFTFDPKNESQIRCVLINNGASQRYPTPKVTVALQNASAESFTVQLLPCTEHDEWMRQGEFVVYLGSISEYVKSLGTNDISPESYFPVKAFLHAYRADGVEMRPRQSSWKIGISSKK